jgi:hypothetical protein
MEHLVAATAPAVPGVGRAVERAMLLFLWLMVGGPMLWGIFKTLQVVQYLFQ